MTDQQRMNAMRLAAARVLYRIREWSPRMQREAFGEEAISTDLSTALADLRKAADVERDEKGCPCVRVDPPCAASVGVAEVVALQRAYDASVLSSDPLGDRATPDSARSDAMESRGLLPATGRAADGSAKDGVNPSGGPTLSEDRADLARVLEEVVSDYESSDFLACNRRRQQNALKLRALADSLRSGVGADREAEANENRGPRGVVVRQVKRLIALGLPEVTDVVSDLSKLALHLPDRWATPLGSVRPSQPAAAGEPPETITLGGIELRFRDGMLQRRFSESDVWHTATYTTVAPNDAERYAAFVRAARLPRPSSGEIALDA